MTSTFLRAALLIFVSILASAASAQAPIVQPGAPGQPPRALSAEEATEIAGTRYSAADVKFMQDMIPHHHQATQMAALVGERTNWAPLVDIAQRIDAAQADEIEFMSDWLASRAESVPDPEAHHHMHMSHEMAGMASMEQMEALAAASGTEFDRLFLELMIDHHAGALTMVEELLEQGGSAYDPVLYEFVNDVANDQSSEIERMSLMLGQISSDPRVGLAAGFRDADEAIWNLRKVAELPKPPGFFDPENPAGLPLEPIDEDEADKTPEAETPEDEEGGARDRAFARFKGEDDPGGRNPLLSFANTDMAFAQRTGADDEGRPDEVLVVGSYHGFNTYRLGDDGDPDLLGSVVCPGGQGDVSIIGDLLIMSAQENRGRLDCGLQGITEDVSPERFRGLRIFDISDLTAPVQVGAVQTCRGSHTHSVVSADEERIVVYNSGTSSVRPQDELEICIDELPGDERTALFRIDVIEIPVDDPASARIVDSPAVFADAETGALAGLWRGGDHGEMTQETNETDHCHDITVFPEKNIAAGACSGNGVLFDITDPMDPKRIDAVVDPGFAYWHSATFNNDGTKVLFTDEWGGGTRPRCRVSDPMTWGANAIYDIVDGRFEFQGYYKLPAPQAVTENCVAHNGSVVPVPGRDIFLQAWYQGGLSILDFTDSDNAFEIAYFDRGPISDEYLITGGYWSAYFYDGRVYASEITRGLDVFALEPSEYLTANEIAAAALADPGPEFNPQQQFPVSWPDVPVVGLAYVDQLNRSNALERRVARDLDNVLRDAQSLLDAGRTNDGVIRRLEMMAETVAEESVPDARSGERMTRLAGVLEGIAENLRG